MSDRFVAVYGRVSDADEEENSSVPQQLRDATAFAKKKWPDERVREFREVVSARNITGRPVFCELLTLCKGEQVKRVIVRDQDRLSRGDAAETLQCLAFLQAHGVEVWEYRTGNRIACDSPHTKLMATVMAGVAAFEREITTLRVKDKICAMRREGKWTGGIPPVGYTVGEVEGQRTLVPNEKAAGVLRVFQTAAETRSLAEAFRVSKALGLWQAKQSLQHALVNRAFMGEFHTAEGGWIKNHHQAIVDEKTFERAQATKALTYNPRERKVDRVFALQGLVFCRHCGRFMTPYHVRKPSGLQIFYYECNQVGKKTCPVKRLPAHELECWTWEQLSELCQKPQILQCALEEHERGFGSENAAAVAQLAALQERRHAAETRRKTLMDFADSFFSKGKMPAESLNDRLLEVEAELKTLKAEIAVAEEKANPPSKINAEEFVRALRWALTSNGHDPAKMQAVFRSLVKRVVVGIDSIQIEMFDPSARQNLLAEGTTGESWFEESSGLAERVGFEPT